MEMFNPETMPPVEPAPANDAPVPAPWLLYDVARAEPVLIDIGTKAEMLAAMARLAPGSWCVTPEELHG